MKVVQRGCNSFKQARFRCPIQSLEVADHKKLLSLQEWLEWFLKPEPKLKCGSKLAPARSIQHVSLYCYMVCKLLISVARALPTFRMRDYLDWKTGLILSHKTPIEVPQAHICSHRNEEFTLLSFRPKQRLMRIC
eukprot:1160727-Pelagomonas_calceolata.AAC.5